MTNATILVDGKPVATLTGVEYSCNTSEVEHEGRVLWASKRWHAIPHSKGDSRQCRKAFSRFLYESLKLARRRADRGLARNYLAGKMKP